jgi:hypothetical protein
MDNDAIARKLAGFGRRKARHLAALQQVHLEECEFLCSLIPDAKLSPEVVALSVAPKDR